MGLLGCDCRAFLDIPNGVYTIEVPNPLPFPPDMIDVDVDFTLAIDICPECGLAGSSVEATISADLPIIPDINASFEGAPVGLPLCEDGTLTVQVAGTLTVGEIVSPGVTVTLVLDANEGEVCIQLPEPLPVIGDEICIPVEGLEIVECPEDES